MDRFAQPALPLVATLLGLQMLGGGLESGPTPSARETSISDAFA